jgi:polar amino acid transport system permease protein
MGYDAQWSILLEMPYRQWIIDGFLLTLKISLVSWVFALILGILIGMLTEAPVKIVRLFSTVYVEIFRNIPLLVQLFFSYFVIPLLLPRDMRRMLYELGWELGSAIFTLSLYTSAKVSEHVRAGLNTVGRDLRWAALSTLRWQWLWESWRPPILPSESAFTPFAGSKPIPWALWFTCVSPGP